MPSALKEEAIGARLNAGRTKARYPPRGNLEQSYLREEGCRVAPQQEGAKRKNGKLSHHAPDAFLAGRRLLLGDAH